MPDELLLENSQVPVTALCSSSGILLSADGPFLRLYDQSQILIKSHRIFNAQAIHGIKVSQDLPDQAIIWGGKWLRTVDIARLASSEPASSKQVERKPQVLGNLLRATDWILDVAIRPTENESILTQDIETVAITAHNDLLAFDFSGGTRVLATGSQCMLYCADLIWISSNRLLIGSGSAFGEITVWTYSWEDAGAVARTHHVFTGHEGSIFGISISQPLRSHKDQSFRILSSCSDDRTICIWDVSDLSEEVEEDDTAHHNTGFSPSPMESMDHLHNHRCLASAMGHASRIWSLRYIYPSESTLDEKSPIVRIVSVGEDATCQSWDLKETTGSSGEAKVYALQPFDSEAWHSGKNIWSIHVPDQAANDRFQVISGGADGRIVTRLAPTNGPKGKFGSCQEWDSSDVTASSTTNTDQPWSPSKSGATLKPPSGDGLECFRALTFIGDGQVLAILNSGLVCVSSRCVDAADKSSLSKWRTLGQFDSLRGYSVAAATADGSFAFFAGSTGVIYCFDHREGAIYEISKIGGKVAALFAEVSPSENSYCVSLVAAYLGRPLAHVTILKPGIAGRLEGFHEWLVDSLTSSVTSATLTIDQNQRILILGCRSGSIYVLTTPVPHPELQLNSTPFSPLQLIALAHGKETVTDVCWIKRISGDQDALGWILSVGRDGACCVHVLFESPTKPLLAHKLILPFGPKIEGLWINPVTSDLFIYGFKSTRFVLYNLTASVEVMTVDCGGAHRKWTFRPNFTPSDVGKVGGSFSWTQASKLKSFSATNSAYEIIQNGGHGREITACVCAPVSLLGNITGPLIATGAEDTDIRLFYSSKDGAGRLNCLAILKKHDTGIQHLIWSDDGRYLFSSGGAGAFFVWHLRIVPVLGVGVVCEAVCPVEEIKSELRITAFVVDDLLPHTNDNSQEECKAEFLITLIYSNSMVKTFRYTSSQGAGYWNLIATGDYTSACLTHTSYMSTPDKKFVLTTSTDGHLVVWDVPASESTDIPSKYSLRLGARHTILCIKKLHQSSIKSCSVIKISQHTFMVATGGDDNALGLSLIQFQDTKYYSSLITIESLLIPRAHSAAIGVISLIPHVHSDQRPEEQIGYSMRVITSGNDQRVKLWSVHLPSLSAGIENLEVRKVANEPTAVADVSGLAILKKKEEVSGHSVKVLICGVGMEIWDIAV